MTTSNIKPRYEIGDTVFAAEIKGERSQVPCPDCVGTKAWEAKLPNGESVDISCPTCQCGYEHRGTVDCYEVTGRVVLLTIGSVRTDTQSKDPVEYMCHETGVGSGRIWREPLLFPGSVLVEAALPALVAAERLRRSEHEAKEYARKKRNSAGAMVSYYRREIRNAERQIRDAEAGLRREANKPSSKPKG